MRPASTPDLPLAVFVAAGGGRATTTRKQGQRLDPVKASADPDLKEYDMTASELAALIGGTVIDNDGDPRIATPSGLLYASMTGKVRLQRYGHPVIDLGRCGDPAEELASAYTQAVQR